MGTPLLEALEQLRPHDHLCSIYETPEEHFSVAVPFIRIGLERREKCIYIADDNTQDQVLAQMRAGGVQVDSALQSGALRVLRKEDAYLKQGFFDPDWMFTYWKTATDEAMAAGFPALRATGETEWVIRGAPGMERWMEYESRLTHTLSQSNCFALCQYNRSVLPPEIILDVIRTHPIVIYGDTVCRNFYFVPAEEFLAPNPTAREAQRMLTNVRDRERMQQELQRAHDELEVRVLERTREVDSLNLALRQKVEELEGFAYSVSHDLRPPLRHIYSLAEELGAQSTAPRIRDHARRMDRMLEDLAILARTGRQDLNRGIVGLRGVLDQVLEELRPGVRDREIRFEIGELPFADCDADLMRQVFWNLLSNAIKFTRTRRPALIEIGQVLTDGQPAVFVRDNGVGFSMKYAGRLFGMFQRLHRAEEFEGSGLGLATVERIIRKHGGRVWAEAELNHGAAFYFTWRAANRATESAARSAPV